MKTLLATAVILSGLLCAGVVAAERSVASAPERSSKESKAVNLLKAEQQQLLREIRAEVAQLPPMPDATEGDSEELRAYRKRRAELLAMLRDIEDRVNLESGVRSVFVTKGDDREPLLTYYNQVRSRIEQEGTKHFPKANGKSAYGRAVVVFALRGDGQIEYVEVVESRSKVIADHAVSLVRRLAPFEAFSAEAAKLADRIVIGARFDYIKD